MGAIVISIQAPTELEAKTLAEKITTNPINAWKVTSTTNNTIQMVVDHDEEAALKLLSTIVSAQPWYAGQGAPLSDALIQTSRILKGRKAQIDAAVDGDFTAAQKFRLVFDPLTLDLDGDGLETTGIAPNAPILFDHNADGIKTGTGWVSADDGMLVLDRNGNGSIDSGLELFGDSTVKSNGQLALDGFDALADLDSNADGQISSTDAQFASLRVWRDLNQDGISQGGELFTLDSLGIASIIIIGDRSRFNGKQHQDNTLSRELRGYRTEVFRLKGDEARSG